MSILEIKQDRTVFYADDDEDDRFLFASALKRISDTLQIHTFENGATLEKALHKTNFQCDVIFLDLNMPVKNGIETLKSLQDEIRKQALKIVVFSTSADPIIVRKTFELNASLFVQKPNTYDELVKVLESVIEQVSSSDTQCDFQDFKFNFQ